MSSAVIEIRDSDNSLNGTLELTSSLEFPLLLTYGAIDIKDISPDNSRWRGGSFSKEFTIPATNANNKLLQSLYDTNILNQKDLKGLKDCVIKAEGIPYIRGQFQINDILFNGETKAYACIVTGDNIEWINDLRNTNLSDLNFGSHTYNQATIEASWTGIYPNLNYYYGLINYGKWLEGSNVTVEDMRPHLYLKAIVDQALSGWTVSSTFMNLVEFKKLIYAYVGNNWNHPQSVIDANTFNIDANQKTYSLGTVGFGDTVNQTFTIDFQNSDNAVFNTTTDTFTATTSGNYTFTGDLTVSFKQVTPDNVFIRVVKNSLLIEELTLVNNFINVSIGGQSYWQLKNTVFSSSQHIIEVGDTVQFEIRVYYQSIQLPGPTYSLDMIIDSSSDMKGQMSNQITRGTSITVANYLKDEPVLGVINGISHAFNLVWKTDVSSKTIVVEPFDQYTMDVDTVTATYNGFYKAISNAVDWTSKLDVSKNPKVSFLQEYTKKIKFKYKDDDKDDFMKQLNEASKKKFGSYTHTFSRFKTGTKTIENPHFAFTHYIHDTSIAEVPVPGKSPILARMWKEPLEGQTIPPYDNDFEPRLLYKNYSDQGGGRSWFWEGVKRTTIPSALSWDADELSNIWDLRFNSTSGLVDRFYGTQLNIIEKGIFVDAYFKINPSEILQVESGALLRTPIYISAPTELKGYYLINEIKNYDPINRRTVKVELIKFENKESITINATETDPSGDGDFGSQGVVPVISSTSATYSEPPITVWCEIDRGDGETVRVPVTVLDEPDNLRRIVTINP